MKGIKGIRMMILLVFIFLLAGAVVASRTQTLQEKTVSVAYQELPEIHLMIATDLHYLSPALTDHGTYFMELIEHSDGKTMEYSEELAEAFTDTVIKQKPDALILTGDLTFNGEKKSHEDLTERLRKIEEAGISVLVLSGNHDLDNRNAASFSKDRYQNLLKHSMFEVGYVIENSEDVLRLYRKYGVLANFTGHLHIQHIEERDGFCEAATSALSVSPNQYADIVLKEGELHYETSPVMVAAWAKENHCTSKKCRNLTFMRRSSF